MVLGGFLVEESTLNRLKALFHKGFWVAVLAVLGKTYIFKKFQEKKSDRKNFFLEKIKEYRNSRDSKNRLNRFS